MLILRSCQCIIQSVNGESLQLETKLGTYLIYHLSSWKTKNPSAGISVCMWLYVKERDCKNIFYR